MQNIPVLYFVRISFTLNRVRLHLALSFIIMSLCMCGMQERRQKRIIYVAFGGSVLAAVVWLIAFCTEGWVELMLPEPGVYLPSLWDDRRQIVLVSKMWNGLWNLCRVERSSGADNVTSSPGAEAYYTDEGIIPATKLWFIKTAFVLL